METHGDGGDSGDSFNGDSGDGGDNGDITANKAGFFSLLIYLPDQPNLGFLGHLPSTSEKGP